MNQLIALDQLVAEKLVVSSSSAILFNKLISASVYAAAIALIAVTIFLMITRKRDRKLEFISIVMLALILVVELIKRLVGRIRPNGELFSFPSRHAAIAFFIALALPVKPLYRVLLIIWAVLVCLSRLILQEHYLSDVVFGAGLGIVAMIFVKQFKE